MLRSCASSTDISSQIGEESASTGGFGVNGPKGGSAAIAFLKRNAPLRSSLRKTRDTASPREGAESGGELKPLSGSRKTVSFCSKARKESKKVSNVADCLQVMQSGTELVKLRTNVRQFRRYYTLDADLAYIRWTPSNKKPHKARIAVDSVKEVRVGWNTENLRATENSGEIQEECAFSIMHGDQYECLDLIALTPEDANIWVTGLMALSIHGPQAIGGRKRSIMATLRERWLTNLFYEADTDRKGFISEKTAVRLIKSINGWLSPARIKHKVKEVGAMSLDESLRGKIDAEQFSEVYKDLATRPEVYFLMVRYANKDYLSCRDLRLFLETEQGLSGISENFCENIIDQCEPCPEAKENNYLTVDGFTNYLLSSANSLHDPLHERVCQDMDQAFHKYFISASFNTYLVEDQLRGPSSVDGYISALKRNCRFIELDVWEPELGASEEETTPSEPVVFHGGTLTSKIPLSEALKVIAELGFERTRYPLFIRLEVHLSIEWQQSLCDLLIKHLGNKLYQPANDPIDWTLPENVPTPKKFANRIILVGNRFESTRKVKTAPSAQQREGEEKEEVDHEETAMVTEEDESYDVLTGKPKKDRRLEMCGRLSSLMAPFAESKHLKEVIENSSTTQFCPKKHLLSMCESTGLRIVHNQFGAFSQLYREFLLRVTPNLARVDSSNLNPQEFWNHGFNLVALNYQTPGLMMDLQEGKFAANGSCGYVRKPQIMLDEGFSPSERLPTTPQVLHLKILSAQQLVRPRGSTAKGDSADPFVVIEVFGLPIDCAEERTKTVHNEVNPTYDENFQFEISLPDLALVRFLVLDDDYIGDDFIGQYTIPFECLQSGYRHIPLLNNEGDPIDNSSLFVHIAITNRRGGGKARKRGMSVKRKTSRVQTGMKVVGVKSIDELFKLASTPLAAFIEMRSQMEAAMVAWQEECGLGPTTTIRQGLRLVHSRVVSAASNATPPLSPRPATAEGVKNSSGGNNNGGVIGSESGPLSFTISRNERSNPLVRTRGAIPDSIQKSLSALELLLRRCEKISAEMGVLLDKLTDATLKINECNSELPQLCTEAGLSSQKSTRAAENFSWNIRLLKAQLTLMSKTQTEANDYLVQVVETAKILGILEETESS